MCVCVVCVRLDRRDELKVNTILSELCDDVSARLSDDEVKADYLQRKTEHQV